MSLTIKQIDKNLWQQESACFKDLNYRQLWEYGLASAARVGAQSEHVGVYLEGELIGLADVRIKKIPIINTGIAYINGGPLTRKEHNFNSDNFDLCLKALISEYVNRRNLSLRINPLALSFNDLQELETVFLNNAFQISTNSKSYQTIIINISQPLEIIRKQLHQKWRNCLNNSEKQNLNIIGGSSLELFEKFTVLYGQLRSRKDFDVDQDDGFFTEVQKKLDDPEKFYISIAEIDGVPVAGHVSSMLGDTSVYLLGASNGQALQTKATYLLQWHTIKTAKERGCSWYDLGGIDPKANPGVYHFKQGMGGVEVTSAGFFEYGPDSVRRAIIRLCERLYCIKKRFKH